MMEHTWIRSYIDSEKKCQTYPMDDFNITEFKELRKEQFWLVFTKGPDTPEGSNPYYSDLIVCSKRENVLKLYRAMNEIGESVPDDAFDFKEMVPMERWWGIYYIDPHQYQDNDTQCLNIVTAETKEEALSKHMKETGVSIHNLYDACEEMPDRKNFYSWE